MASSSTCRARTMRRCSASGTPPTSSAPSSRSRPRPAKIWGLITNGAYSGVMDLALKLDGVTKRYGGFTAVRDLSFHVKRGAILGFLGPNGAGKTTTLRMILGLVAPSAGRVEVLGEADGRRVRSRIGFLPEERGLYRRMTPVGAIAFFASLKGLPMIEARKRARQLLADNGLESAADRQIRALSKGMAQKVQLLSAIAHDPELVILDEPFSGLDPVNQKALEGLIRGLAAR